MNHLPIGEMLSAPLLFGFGNVYTSLKKTEDGAAEPVYIGINGIYSLRINSASGFANVFGTKSLRSPDTMRKKTVQIVNSVCAEVLAKYFKSHETLKSRIGESYPALEAEFMKALSANEKLQAAGVTVCSLAIDGVSIRETHEILPITTETERKRSLAIRIASVFAAALLATLGVLLFVFLKSNTQDKKFLKGYVESERLSLYMYDKKIVDEFGDGGVFQIAVFYDGETIPDYDKLSVEISDESVGSVLVDHGGKLIMIPRKSGICYIKVSYLGETLIRKWCAFPNWQLHAPLQMYLETSWVQDGFYFGNGGPDSFTGFVIYRGVLVKDMENLKITVEDPSLGTIEKYDDGRLLFRQTQEGDMPVTLEYNGETVRLTWKCHEPQPIRGSAKES